MGSFKYSHVTKVYDNGVEAVKDFNLEIQDGEFIVLVGPSGCGKSTVLRMTAGLEAITDGELTLNGKVINKMAPADRDIAMVFQDYALYGNLSVYNNVGMRMTIQHEDEEIAYDKIMDASKKLGLVPLLNRMPDQLSGGQKQRVALGRTIVRTPQATLMDEPLSNLDAKLRDSTRREIVKLQKEHNLTTLYVTHDQTEAMSMADRIVCMRDGVVQQVGTPIEIYHKPVNLFVAGFIGSPTMNMLDGEIHDGCFCCAGKRMPLPEGKRQALKDYEGKKMVMGVRPEYFLRRDASAEDTLDLCPIAREYLGTYYLVHFDFGEEGMVCRFDDISGSGREPCHLAVNMNLAHFFDMETTIRMA